MDPCVDGDAWQKLLALTKEHAPVKQYVVDKYLREHDRKVLRLPPYRCQFNAIALIWALVRQYVNCCVYPNDGG